MISSEAQRTLVKSPPELWAEISDPEALARHLGEFGEIRITRVHPEQRVDWETADASGSVVIKPSGWGTKVKLTVSRELREAGGSSPADQAGGEDESPPVAEAIATSEPTAAPDAAPESNVVREPIVVAREPEPEPVAAEPSPSLVEPAAREPEEAPAPGEEPESRRGLLDRIVARLRARRRSGDPDLLDGPVEVADRADPIAQPAEREPAPGGGDPLEPASEPATDLVSVDRAAIEQGGAEALAGEESAGEDLAAVLTGVLDRLGAAHHRPFSRA